VFDFAPWKQLYMKAAAQAELNLWVAAIPIVVNMLQGRNALSG
jgi:hypothetical protein